MDADVDGSPQKQCILCGFAKGGYWNQHGVMAFECPQCGYFECSDEFIMFIQNRLTRTERASLAGVVREKWETKRSGDATRLLQSNYEALLSLAPKQFDVSGKVRKLLLAVARRTEFAGDVVNIGDTADAALAYAQNIGEFIYLREYAKELGWLEITLNDRELMHEEHRRAVSEGRTPPLYRDWQVKLTPAGWEEIQRRPRSESPKAFVAMWFNEATDSAWLEGIKPAIEQCGYDATRIDAVPHNGPIVDKILAEIRDSRFLVCDLTTDGADRGGVYFEAGFAMGLGMEVIFTFRDAPDNKGPHFDVAPYNQVRWTTPEELRERLQDRINATIGRGPLSAL